MADIIVLNAEIRDRAGKGAARAVRREGRVPAVIYGNKIDPLMISLEPVELMMQLRKAGFYSSVFDVKVAKDLHRVLARDVQFDPVTDRPLHVDFMRFSADTIVTVDVPVVFLNEETNPGIKRGAVLNIVRRELELECPADRIPEVIEVDLAGFDIGDSIHISAVNLPEGVTPTITDRDFTIATIAAPSSVRSEASAEGDEEGAGSEEGD